MSVSTSSRPLPRPLHLIPNSNGATRAHSQLSASTYGPLSAPLSIGRNGSNCPHPLTSGPISRRQSSISYNTGSSKPRSPGLGRSNSLGSEASLSNAKESVGRDEAGSSGHSPSLTVRGNEAATLAEKHADLLRFIAQKESKCLELRTQLAQHEADLLLLKRKWERIVSKGLPSSARSGGPSSVRTDMLDGIREGVQSGLGKVFAVLEPSSPAASSAARQPLSSPPLKSEGNLDHLGREPKGPASTVSSKRESIGTASSSSTRDRSSLSESRSSASSLFDELSSLDHQSLASSADGDSTICPSSGKDPSEAAAVKQASTFVVPPEVKESERNNNLPLRRQRQPRPSSMNLSQISASLTASMPTDASSPLSRQVANWMPPGLNKKWEELKGGETLSKQSKRASLLLSDVLAVLAPPISPSPQAPSSSAHVKRNRRMHSSPHHVASTCSESPVGANLGARPISFRISSSPSPSEPSLLDEDESECRMGDVLQPEVIVAGAIREGVGAKKEKEKDKEEDEWNW